MSRVIPLAPGAATFDANGAGGGINAYPLHAREIDNHAIIAGPQARTTMPATAYGQRQILLAGEVDRCDHVGHIRTANDQRRVPVDHAIVDLPRLLVAIIAETQQ